MTDLGLMKNEKSDPSYFPVVGGYIYDFFLTCVSCSRQVSVSSLPPYRGNKRGLLLPSPKGRAIVNLTNKRLNQRHSSLFTFLSHIVRPDAGLDFSDMGLMQQHHAETALTYSASNAERELIIEQTLMEI